MADSKAADPVRHCSWCEPENEIYGTCKKFFRKTDDGWDKCSAEYSDKKCVCYEPIGHCPNCGAKMGGGTP